MVKKSLVFVVNKALFYFYQTLYSKVSKTIFCQKTTVYCTLFFNRQQ